MKYMVTACIMLLSALGIASMTKVERTAYAEHTLQQFKIDAKTFALSADTLKNAIARITPKDRTSVLNARKALVQCRLRYKRIEYFMEYFFQYPVNLYNRAPAFEIEEPYMEYQSPVGLQQVEALLADDAPWQHKKEIADQCDVICSSASDIPSVTYNLNITDHQVLDAIRLELVRIITLGITGYDAPVLKTGIDESAEALRAVQENLHPYLSARDGREADSLSYYLQLAINMLADNKGFDDFDRLGFITRAALPLQKALRDFLKKNDLQILTNSGFNPDAEHLFSRNAIIVDTSSPGADKQTTLAAIGKMLFFDTRLSGNNSRSCATCHQPGKFFTDGLVKSKTIDGKGVVTRNAPSLLYAAFQHSQFYDGRAASLEEQIKTVLQNPEEMNADMDKITAYINSDLQYRQAYQKFLPGGQPVNAEHIAMALAAYERTLAPFNSPFDRYIAGDADAMTPTQKKGFNLFMGKAQCGTCHFAPLFNGLLPPGYNVTELEVIGVPKNNDFEHPKADADSGRYYFFPISFNNGAFKTTTVRNAAATAPYMHNGAFSSLDEVIAFYNKGGGKGIGLNIEMQTLSEKELKLTKAEAIAIKSFIAALTDNLQALKD